MGISTNRVSTCAIFRGEMWKSAMTETDALLAGKRLIPFWRNSEKDVNWTSGACSLRPGPSTRSCGFRERPPCLTWRRDRKRDPMCRFGSGGNSKGSLAVCCLVQRIVQASCPDLRPRVAWRIVRGYCIFLGINFASSAKFSAELAAAKLAIRHFDFSVAGRGRRPLFLSRRKTRKFTARLPNRHATDTLPCASPG